jgi:hypothetical protein
MTTKRRVGVAGEAGVVVAATSPRLRKWTK